MNNAKHKTGISALFNKPLNATGTLTVRKVLLMILFLGVVLWLIVWSMNSDISDYRWTMVTAQSTGMFVATSPDFGAENDAMYAAADEIVLVCTAENGILTLTDETNGKTYEGTYKMSSGGFGKATYEIAFGDSKGYANIDTTVYDNPDQIPTMYISIGGEYVLFLMAE
ncbi:MAG: hypothetical protein IJY08_05265 [Clostridia bacterium]|nr:hypothetical protein [Clostridia bacterium]